MQRLNEYRVMWIMVMYDLPTFTKKDRKIASDFRKKIIQDGFTMFQFSSYIRHCASMENAQVHIKRVKQIVPEKGTIGIISFTDKQFENMEIFYGEKAEKAPDRGIQLELF